MNTRTATAVPIDSPDGPCPSAALYNATIQVRDEVLRTWLWEESPGSDVAAYMLACFVDGEQPDDPRFLLTDLIAWIQSCEEDGLNCQHGWYCESVINVLLDLLDTAIRQTSATINRQLTDDDLIACVEDDYIHAPDTDAVYRSVLTRARSSVIERPDGEPGAVLFAAALLVAFVNGWLADLKGISFMEAFELPAV